MDEATEPTEVTAEETSTLDEATAEPTSAAPAEATNIPEEAPVEAGGEGTASGEAAPDTEQETPTPESSILGEIPDETAIMVVNTEGQSEPLAAQTAAEAIATSDPIWCPATVTTPTPGANGCTDSFTSFDGLLTFLSGNAAYQGAGTIYVQEGAYNGGEAVIDFNSAAYDLSNIRNSDLTVTGGWNTANNTVDPASLSIFTVPIVIGTGTNPWGGSLSINNILVRDVANPTNPTGLTLHSNASINLSNVTVTNVQEGSGAELNAATVVTIVDSKFLRNKNAGATIRAGGNVTIVNSSFSNPANARRQNTGLDVETSGSVSLFSVVVDENRKVGAHIFAGGDVTIGNSSFSETKDFTTSGGTTTFYGYGLQVETPGTISLDGVTATGNFLWGASLTNTSGTNDITISRSIFNANSSETNEFIDDTGLIVRGGGNVTLDTVEANDNPMIGADIQAAGLVAVTNSEFSNNRGMLISNGVTTFFGYGLQIVAGSTINLDGVTASNNRLFGAHLEAGSDVNVANSTFDNQNSGSATDPTGRGLEVISGGIVTLSNVSVSNNQLFGANIQAPGNVFLDNVTADNNGTDGVQVNALCALVIGGSFSGNTQYGLNLGATALNLSGSPIFSGNGAGDIFPANPPTCAPPVVVQPAPPVVVNPGTITNSVVPSSNVFVPQPIALNTSRGGSPSGAGMSTSALTLNRFAGNLRTLNGDNELSIFIGEYIYIHTDFGIQIFAFSPASDSLAKGGS
jgi:hypothetical protein